MIEISPTIRLEESELHYDFIRAAGPGGQNVNKVSSAVQLRFNVLQSASLPDDVRQRLVKLAGRRINQEGELVIRAAQYRTQEQNRFDALERLVELVRQAAEKPRVRKSTRPTVTAKARRLASKKQHGEIKRLRRYIPEDWE